MNSGIYIMCGFFSKFILFIQGPKFCDNYEQFKWYTLYIIYTQCARDGSDNFDCKVKNCERDTVIYMYMYDPNM